MCAHIASMTPHNVVSEAENIQMGEGRHDNRRQGVRKGGKSAQNTSQEMNCRIPTYCFPT